MLKVVKSGACMAMVIAISLVVGATVFNTVHAEDPYQDAGVGYTVNVAPSLKVTLSSNNVVLNLNPNTHTSDSGDLDISVSTNNATGYTMTMASTGDATALSRNSTADGKTASIPTLSAAAGTTPASLTDNTWGYRLSETDNFIPYVSGTQIMNSSGATNNDEATVSFASKINYSQAAGTYSLGLTLAAVSNPPISYLQDVTDSTCTTSPTIAVDKRDNQEYVIQRLADGRCWMMDNLNLGATDTLAVDQLDSTNTNLTGSNASKTIDASTFLGSTWKKSSGSGTFIAPEYIPITASNSATGSDTDPTSNTKYGTLYNYCAATAQTYCYNDSTNGGDASSDLCPAGWRLPTGNTSGEFQTLYNQSAYNSLVNMRKSYENGGAAFALASFFYTSTPTSQGSNGNYWSSTRISNTNMYYLYFSTSNVNPADNSYRNRGYSIRCVLKDDTRSLSDISTMQEVNHDVVLNTATGASKTLTDTRDSKQYTVVKLADDNIWMTENLNLAGGTALSADDTNVTSTYISGFTTQGNLTKNANNTISLPASSTSGFNNGSNAYVYNTSSTTCGNGIPCYGYYSWIAATLGGKQANGSAAEGRDGYNAAASICPKGWKLPFSTTSNAPAQTSPNWKTGDFYKLATAYGANLESNYYENSATFYNNAGPGKVPNFLLSGIYGNNSFNNGGEQGRYWSSSSKSSTYAYAMSVGSSFVFAPMDVSRDQGISVRCLAR